MREKMYEYFIRNIFATIISIIVLIILLPKYGLIGAAISYMINYILAFIFLFKRSFELFYYDFQIRKKIKLIFGVIIIEVLMALFVNISDSKYFKISEFISIFFVIILILITKQFKLKDISKLINSIK